VLSRYGVDPDDDAYFGHSLGGLFGTYALLAEPTRFRRYGVGSPSLWWDHGAIFEHEAAYGRRYPSLEIDQVVLPGEFHVTVPLLNLSRSLRYLFDAPT
jgi:hypothetical protein